jgi:hypothetical protein
MKDRIRGIGGASFVPFSAGGIAFYVGFSSICGWRRGVRWAVGMGHAGQDDFTAAASFWSSVLTNNVTINLTVGTAALGGTILGETSTADVYEPYSALRGDLIAGKTSASDTLATSNLPSAASGLKVLINHTTDDPAGSNSSSVFSYTSVTNPYFHMTTPNARALGFGGTGPLGFSTAGQSLSVASGATCTTCDAIIEFTTGYSWDYNRADGITAGSYDFTGAAIHEIAHALGFVSGVDTLDHFATGTPTSASILTNF